MIYFINNETMQVAIISDIHDHLVNFASLLKDLKQRRPDHLLVLWDFGAPGTVIKPLLGLEISTNAIRWNNDGEVQMITVCFERASHATMSRKTYDRVELDGKKIFMTHYADLAEPMAQSGLYDLVCSGHDHLPFVKQLGNTIRVDPGAIMGNKNNQPTYAIYNTQTNQLEIIEL